MHLFLRRLLALSYDSFILICLWLILSTAVVIALKGHAVPLGAAWYRGVLVATAQLFFIGFWCWGGGQTIGLKAWGLRLVSNKPLHGLPVKSEPVLSGPSFLQAALYFGIGIASVSCLGLGWWWCLFNKERLTLYEWCSQTKLVFLVKT